MLNLNEKGEVFTECYNVKDHMAFFPVLFHAYAFKQSLVIPPYVHAVIFFSAIQHTGIPSLIV